MNKKISSIIAALALMLIAAAPLCAKPWGIVATGPDFFGTDNASIHVIDLGAVPPVVYGPFLQEYFKSAEALDIALLKSGRKALISAYENGQVLVVDLNDPTNPIVERTFDLPFFAEDIALTRNGKLALVTDGSSSPWVAFIDLQKVTANSMQLPDGKTAQAVAIARKNIAVFADYYNNAIHFGKINKTKNGLESVQSIALCDEGQHDNATDCMGPVGWPVNVTIAPNGRTALVASGLGGVVFVFEITPKGAVVPGNPFILTGLPGGTLEMPEGGQQSITFADKKTAYVASWRAPLGGAGEAVAVPGGMALPDAPGDQPSQLSQINVVGPGKAEVVPARYTLVNSPFGFFFGVDTLDIFNRCALAGNIYHTIGTPFDNPYYNQVVFIDLVTGILTPIELNNYGYAAGVGIKK